MGTSLIYYAIWLFVVFLIFFINGYVSIFNKNVGGSKWFLLTWLAGALPLWALISKYSKDLVFDSMMFDIVVLAGFYMGFFYFGEMDGLSWHQWLGLGMCIFGLVMMKL